MKPPLAARLEPEVFHSIGDICSGPVDSDVRQALIQKLTGRPDKRFAADILAVSWLFANNHEFSARRPLTKHRLRCAV